MHAGTFLPFPLLPFPLLPFPLLPFPLLIDERPLDRLRA
jgi:hypothetical protein